MFKFSKKVQGFLLVSVLVLALCPTVQADEVGEFMQNVAEVARQAAINDYKTHSPVMDASFGIPLGRAGVTMMNTIMFLVQGKEAVRQFAPVVRSHYLSNYYVAYSDLLK